MNFLFGAVLIDFFIEFPLLLDEIGKRDMINDVLHCLMQLLPQKKRCTSFVPWTVILLHIHTGDGSETALN